MPVSAPTNLPALLAYRAAERPDKVAVRCDDEAITYGDLHARAGSLAAGLSRLGIGPGDPVCVLLETSSDYVAVWLALNWIGAVEVPINTGFKGEALAHALRLTGAGMLIADDCFLELLAAPLGTATRIARIVVRGKPDRGSCDAALLAFDSLLDGKFQAPPIVESAPDNTSLLLFTSGSTGPSKACRIPHRYVLRQPQIFCEQLGITEADTLYAPFPLFHADGAIFTVAAAISAGATAALARRFSVSGFWDDCRRHGATVIDYMGATLAMLFRQPPSARDRDHQVRLGWGVPAPSFAEEFERRFGIELVEVYGLSDAGIPLYNAPGEPRRKGSCGRAVPPFEVRIHDADGRELPDGETGEIVIRSSEPHLVTTGYFGDPGATGAAFRNDWFRTGDLARRDADGYFYFVGRLKDIIRRRGENISAFDVEQALLSHPDIVEAAAYGVPSELTEEDVMATVVPRAGASVDAFALRQWLMERLARHMVPRYLRLASEIPRTPTEKVAKHLLAAEGISAGTIDFEKPRAPTEEQLHVKS